MSRSRTGKHSSGGKGAGYDYWGRRALSGNCGHGKEVKVITHRIERARAKASTRKEPVRER
jgi:hypothetical protein